MCQCIISVMNLFHFDIFAFFSHCRLSFHFSMRLRTISFFHFSLLKLFNIFMILDWIGLDFFEIQFFFFYFRNFQYFILWFGFLFVLTSSTGSLSDHLFYYYCCCDEKRLSISFNPLIYSLFYHRFILSYLNWLLKHTFSSTYTLSGFV